ncbi:DNA translocase FtsK-like [Uranotaenia lowii]|uniref:DNA translocase FtsK-like n=1 Tax=Uranotaenia lowii TaxID=190385 RepID=UPI002478568A|nr:DNA translocase FtsK-like [Uranotaenia lowii]
MQRDHAIDNNNRQGDVVSALLRHINREPQSNEPANHRRWTKAVHNWACTFRGEKDTTSLNIFLDQVEMFAASEDLSEDALMASIKHLLRDDALKWYITAMAQGMLTSWEAFKNEIRREFLPKEYAHILRLEASFRLQGQNESFSKYYREITTLFRFVSPPLNEGEKFFIVKKNMSAAYATVVAAARPTTLEDLADVCESYDETRALLSRQRSMSIAPTTLLEPSFATPAPVQRPHSNNQPPRFNRVSVVEGNTVRNEAATQAAANESPEQTEEEALFKMEKLMEEVNAIKARFNKDDSRPTITQQKQTSAGSWGSHQPVGSYSQALRQEQQQPPRTFMQTTLTRQQQPSLYVHQREYQQPQQQYQQPQQQYQQPQQQYQQPQQQYQQRREYQQPQQQDQQHQGYQQPHQQSFYSQNWYGQQETTGQQLPSQPYNQPQIAQSATVGQQRYLTVAGGPIYRQPNRICWNCDEEGHRFMNCPLPQAILFCYRCGRKGYSLRSCFTCRTDAENPQAGNQQ